MKYWKALALAGCCGFALFSGLSSAEEAKKECGSCGGSSDQVIVDNAGDTSVMENTFHCVHALKVTEVPVDAKTVRLWLPVPQSDDNQTVSDVKVLGGDGEVVMEMEPEQGNQFACCTVKVAGKPEYSFSYEFTVTRKKQSSLANCDVKNIRPLNADEAAGMAKYLGADRNVTIDDTIRNKANEVCGDEKCPVGQAKKVYDWIVDHGEYWKKDKTKYAASGHGNTQYFMDKCTGNCTDFHAAFMSMMRSRGIPTRIWFGGVFWADKDGKDEDISYHCWPEYYVPGLGWAVLDASQGDYAPEKCGFYFGNLESRRIVFCQGRDINLAPRQDGDRLEFLGTGYAEVDGKPYAKIARKLSYNTVK